MPEEWVQKKFTGRLSCGPSRLTRNNCREKFIQGIITDAMRIATAISGFVLCQVIRQGLRVALALFCRSLALSTWRMYCQAGSVSKTTTKNIPAKPQVIVYCNRVFRRRTKIEACHIRCKPPPIRFSFWIQLILLGIKHRVFHGKYRTIT